MPDDSPLPRGAQAFRFALLMERFKLTPAQIANLTDYQIGALYFHARDRDGKLRPPAELDEPTDRPVAPSREGKLADIARLEAMRLITPERATELRAEVNRDAATGG